MTVESQSDGESQSGGKRRLPQSKRLAIYADCDAMLRAMEAKLAKAGTIAQTFVPLQFAEYDVAIARWKELFRTLPNESPAEGTGHLQQRMLERFRLIRERDRRLNLLKCMDANRELASIAKSREIRDLLTGN